MELFISPTKAYLTEREIALLSAIMSWVNNDDIFASVPQVWCAEIGEGYFISTQFGHCPADSGVTGYFKVTEEAFLYWETESEAWNWDMVPEVNLAKMLPMSFATLEALSKYIATGEW